MSAYRWAQPLAGQHGAGGREKGSRPQVGGCFFSVLLVLNWNVLSGSFSSCVY